MSQTINHKPYFELEERCLYFAKHVGAFVKKLPRSVTNFEYGKQLIRSSGSVGANYIEANEALSKKDFVMRVKISKKEAKESWFWLNLIEPEIDKRRDGSDLIQECIELMKIFGSIIEKSK